MVQVRLPCLPPELSAAFAAASQALGRTAEGEGRAEVGDAASPSPALAAHLQADPGQSPSTMAQTQLAAPPEDIPATVSTGADEELQDFIKGVSAPAPKPILRTPAKKAKAIKGLETPSVNRSGRLATKTQAKGRNSSEDLAQEILRRKGHQANRTKRIKLVTVS
jgi:hypothetical protein